MSASSAAHVIAGFRYQLLQSVSALIALRDNEELLLEVSEDFTIVAQDDAIDVQVKNSQAARGPRPFSLQSPEVASVLQRYWEASNGGVLKRRLIFLARGGAAVERDYSFPGELPGLTYWRAAALGADTQSLREALIDILSEMPLGLWLESNPDDADLRSRLLHRVQWELDSISAEQLVTQLRDQIGELYYARNLPVMAANQAVRSLTDVAFETAAKPHAQDRLLTRLDLVRVMEETAASLLLAQTIAAPTPVLNGTAHSVLVSELEGLAPSMAQRADTIGGVLSKTTGQPLIWIHGSNGVGKSTLARLVGQKLGGCWLELDLRPVQNSSPGSLAAWRELTRMIALAPHADGIIIDDFDDEAANILRTRLSALTRMLGSRGVRIIVTSHHEPTAAFLLECGAAVSATIQAPYFSDADVAELVNASPSPAGETVNAWIAFIRLSTGGGHPLLVAAKISSLRARSWPNTALIEDIIGEPSDAIRLSRYEARRTLLSDLAELDQARSLDAGSLLRRIGCVFDRVEDGLIRQLAIADPSLPNGGDALAVLRGTWLEPMPGGDLRVSPLLADIASDVPLDKVHDWRCIAAEYWLQKRTLTERTLPLCFWNAYLGEHTGVLMVLCNTIQTMPKDRLRGAAALLSPMTALAADKPLSSNPAVAVQLRLLQFDVADAIEEGLLAGAIALRLMEEVATIDHADIRAMMVHIATTKFLMAEFAEIAPADRISYALALREAEPRTLALAEGKMPDPMTLLPEQFKPGMDMADFLFSMVTQHIASSDDELEVFHALNGISSNVRDRFIDAMSAIYEGPGVFVHSGWSRDESESRDMTVALDRYGRIELIAAGWDRPDVLVEAICARSIIMDEGLNRFDEAISVVDAAISNYGPLPTLIRQKSKVLGHADRHLEAVTLLIQVEDEVGIVSPFDRSLALRDGALSAAKSGRLDDALRLIDKALASLAMVDGSDALIVGLSIERSLMFWRAGKRECAIGAAADALELVERFSETSSRQAERSHQYARAIIGLFLRELDGSNVDNDPPFNFGAASSLESGKAALTGADLKPLADNWRILALAEAIMNLDAGIEVRSMKKQSGPLVGSIEVLIRQSRYENALRSKNFTGALRRGCEAVTATKLILGVPRGPNNLYRIAASDLTAIDPLMLGKDESMQEAIQGVVLDVLLYGVCLSGGVDRELVDALRLAVKEVFGSNRDLALILDAASGYVEVSGETLASAVYAAAMVISEKAMKENLSVRFYRDMMTIGRIANSVVGKLLASVFISRMVAGWLHVLKDQRFMLRSPASNVPVIEAAIEKPKASDLASAATILLAAAPAVGYKYSKGWEELLKRIAF